MNTNLLNRSSEIEREETDITIVPYEPREEIESSFIKTTRPVVRWFGFLSTTAWCAAALLPDTFRVPVSAQGWVFTVAILWFFSFCAGLFNL
jgi:hypothetical protein